MGLLCTAVAYILYFRLIADIGPMRSLDGDLSDPPFGILWGYLVLDETLSPNFFLGALIVCVAVWLLVSGANNPPAVK